MTFDEKVHDVIVDGCLGQSLSAGAGEDDLAGMYDRLAEAVQSALLHAGFRVTDMAAEPVCPFDCDTCRPDA